MITDLPTVTNIYQIYTYKMAAKINWHRYRTKLRHCHYAYAASCMGPRRFCGARS